MEILRSKFGTFRNFHTMLYTCAREFDFLDLETPQKLALTFLLPTVAFIALLATYQLLLKMSQILEVRKKKGFLGFQLSRI